jgi:hypothetical protein
MLIIAIRIVQVLMSIIGDILLAMCYVAESALYGRPGTFLTISSASHLAVGTD